ncbi:MAG: cobalamin adenosyltransferase [Clostridiales bacterium]|nr:cobalamin adenosyltransferase [Clostridiales bacterium]
MKFITEDDLRDIYRKDPFTSYEIQPGARLTPGARQFLQDRQINVFADGTAMHVGDGVVAGREPGVGTPDLLKDRRLGVCLKSAEALFLLTASELMELDVVLAQEVLQLGRKFEEIKYMAKEGKTFEPVPFRTCEGMTAETFCCDIGDCFDITEFHMQTEKGRQILLLHRLRCELYEVQVTVMEVRCTNKAVTERLNQIINYISQLICKAFGGGECLRNE